MFDLSSLKPIILSTQKTLKQYGFHNQIIQVSEECAELLVALSKFRRGTGSREDVLEEVADVIIVALQSITLTKYDLSDLEKKLLEKHNKLLQRIKMDEGLVEDP